MQFDASVSADIDGAIVTYSWDFGDDSDAVSASNQTTHVYTVAGSITVTLTVTDNLGATSSSRGQVEVTAATPQLTLTVDPEIVTAGQKATLTWAAQFATSCAASGGWSGNRPKSGSEVTAPITSTTTYTLTCTGEGGEIARSVSVQSRTQAETLTYEEYILRGTLDYMALYESTGVDQANQLLAGTYNGSSVTLPFDWSLAGIDDRTFSYSMHAFTFFASLISAYTHTGDPKYADAMLDWMLDWIQANPTPLEGNQWAWHDDATARRVFTMCVAIRVLGEGISPTNLALILESLDKQVQLLSSEDFYTAKHNHGMFQDRAVAMYAITAASETERARLLTLAKERVSQYFDYAIAPDGVLKEHSPSYHVIVARQIEWFRVAYGAYDEAFHQELHQLLERMCEFMVQVRMPNDTNPAIGDSTRTAFSEEPYWASIQEYQWVNSGGSQGTAPENTMAVFSHAGYGIMRSDWTVGAGTGTWMLLGAATHSLVHKHNDDLSFLLYHNGDLFVEAGNRDYNYAEEETRYCYSAYGHNVLFVNGEGFAVNANGLPLLETTAFETRITQYNDTSETRWVTARQTRFENVAQERTLYFNQAVRFVRVLDSLAATEALDARLIYHIASGVQVEETQNGWRLSRDGVLVALIVVAGSTQVQLSTASGEGEAPYWTWIFEGRKEPVSGSLLIVDMACIQGENVVSLGIQLADENGEVLPPPSYMPSSAEKGTVQVPNSDPP